MDKLWSRRQMLALSSVTLLAAALPSVRARATTPMFPPATKAADLYARSFVLDCNCLASIGGLLHDEDTEKQLRALRESGLSALKSTLGGASGNFEETVADVAAAQALIDRYPDTFVKVIGYDDLERAKRENKVAVIFSFEGVAMLDGKIERIEMFRQLGVRVMQLSYNRKSAFACGCLDGDSDGVTELGRRAIAKMNEIGVALDLSHANTRTTADGILMSSKPAIITHAGCRAVFAHPRNKNDRELKALADKGGVIGVYMMPFLTADTRQPMLADFMQHLVHALKVCGEDHVGIGSDTLFFEVSDEDLKAIAADEARRKQAGIGAPGENRPPYLPDANTPRKLEQVTDALLKNGYGERVTEKVLGLNFKRVFNEIWAV